MRQMPRLQLARSELAATESSHIEELTSREQTRVDRILAKLRSFDFSTYDCRNENEEEIVYDSFQELLAFGERILPYLADKMRRGEIPEYEYSRLFNALGEEQSLSLALELLPLRKIYRNTDGSTIGKFCHYLGRTIHQIRSENPQDPRLDHITTSLLQLLKTPAGNEFIPDEIYKLLSLTGTTKANNFIASLPESKTKWLFHTQPLEKIKVAVSFPKTTFETWEEVKDARARARPPTYRSLHDDYEVDHPVTYTEDWPYNAYSDDLAYPEHPLDNAPLESVTNDAPSVWERELPSGVVEAIHATRELIQEFKQEIAPTAEPAIILHLFNFIYHLNEYDRTATRQALKEEFRRINRLSKQERAFADPHNPLPTIGVEVEIPAKWLTKDKVVILNALGIPNYAEQTDSRQGPLWEVNPSFSHSPWPQSRILQELAVLGAIPLEVQTIDQRPKLASDAVLSLHINFGLPPLSKHRYELETLPDTNILNDILIYGFTSALRISSKKSSISLDIKSRDQTAHEEQIHPVGDLLRLELKSAEFKDYPTYRLLAEAQQLAAALCSHLKKEEQQNITQTEALLALVWKDFKTEAVEVIAAHSLSFNSVDRERNTVQFLLENTQLKKRSRSLITHYAKIVAGVLKASGVELPQQEALAA